MAQAPVFQQGFLVGFSPLPITSLFGVKRGNHYHAGIDIGCPVNTAINCPVDGEIQKVGFEKNGYGLYLVVRYKMNVSFIVDHPILMAIATTVLPDAISGALVSGAVNDYIDIYFAHLTSVSTKIHLYESVKAGTFLARTGGEAGGPNSGDSQGPHLHLEIRHKTTAINPGPFLFREKCFLRKTNKSLWNNGVFSQDVNYYVDELDFKSLSTNKITQEESTTTVENATEKISVPPPIKTTAELRPAAGIWGIVKLIMDSSISNKQVVDTSIASQQGSLLNFFHKVCQEPMVEFFGDTYGDQYYLIARRPPFDQIGVKNMMDLSMIELNPDDLISSALDWNTEGIYSWYQLMPKCQLMLGDYDLSILVPAVFFPEYADIWGSKPLAVESNYFTWLASGKYNSDKQTNQVNDDNIIRNAFADLKYLIECNAYAPFTRRGTITINGDRRYKKGMLLQHVTGEIFYIDGVTNDYNVTGKSVSRKTTLTVSRGMYPEFVSGVEDVNKNNISYFNIIDFGQNKDKITSDNWQEVMSKWKVDPNVFAYFMRKEQLIQHQISK